MIVSNKTWSVIEWHHEHRIAHQQDWKCDSIRVWTKEFNILSIILLFSVCVCVCVRYPFVVVRVLTLFLTFQCEEEFLGANNLYASNKW